MQNGGSGIMIWELSQDILDPNYYQYSLLNAIDLAMQPYLGPTCAEPNLGADKTLCGVQGGITLNSNLSSQPYRTFSWYKDGSSTPGSGTTLSVSTAGTYVVMVDSSGACSNTDTIVVSATLPNVNLGSSVNLCAASSATLDAGVSGNGITYQWSKNSVNINGATAQTYAATSAGTYSVTVSASGCADKSGSVTVTSSLLNVNNDTICVAGDQATLTVSSVGGPFKWYDAASNGTLLYTGATYAANYNSNTTLYVQDGAGVGGTVGGTGSFGTAQWQNPQNFVPMTFTTSVAGMTITSADFYIPAWAKANNFVVSIKSGNTVIGSSAPITYDNSSNGSNYKVTVSLNIVLTNAGTYTLGFSSSTSDGSNAVNKGTASYPLTEGSNSISFTAGDYVFNNIQFVAGSTCVRTPVTVTIDANNVKCLSTSTEDLTLQLSVFPNPSNDGKFIIAGAQIQKVEVYNLVGEQVLISSNNQIDLSGFTAGMYMLKVLNSQGVISSATVIKQ
jgi:hypothetical protein